MNCCTTDAYDAQFDGRQARSDLKRFRTHGPEPTTRALVDAIAAAGVRDATVLDIGGGVGAVHHELFAAGAAFATHVDASAAYLDAARDESTRRGTAERVRFLHGDFVGLAAHVAAADVVTLDRVICCYADMEALVAASASRAKRLYGAVFPRERWSIQVGFAAMNWFKRVTGNAFRVYLHPVAAIDAALRRQGFQLQAERQTFVWRVAVYART